MKYYTKSSFEQDFLKIEVVCKPPVLGVRYTATRATGAPSSEELNMISGIYSSITSEVAIGQFIGFDIQENGHGIFNYRDENGAQQQKRF